MSDNYVAAFDHLGFVPPQMMSKHAKPYASWLMDGIKANAAFKAEVTQEIYPQPENGWGMDPDELYKFMAAMEKI